MLPFIKKKKHEKDITPLPPLKQKRFAEPKKTCYVNYALF